MADLEIDQSKAAAYALLAQQEADRAAAARDQAIRSGNAIEAIRQTIQGLATTVQAWLGQGSVGHRWIGTVLEILSPNGSYGPGVDLKGDTGWSPVWGFATDHGHSVVQLADWIGGTGEKPGHVGEYIGASGFVTDIDDAVHVASGGGGGGFGEAQLIGGDHTAAIGDFLNCNTAEASFTLTLPAEDGVVALEDSDDTWSTNALTIAAGEDQTIDGEATITADTAARLVLVGKAGVWRTKEVTALYPFPLPS